MPPRRRGKAATARAAAIEAVQQKKKHAEVNTTPSDDDDQEDIMSNYEDEQEEYHHPNINNQHHHHSSCSHHNHNHDHHSCSGARGKAKTTTKYGKKKKISHDNNKGSNNVGDADLESELDDGLDGDSPPPLVDTPLVDSDDDDEDDEEYCDNGSCDGEDDDAVGSAEGAAGANSSSNTMSGEGGCLHCHKSASNADIQVRCDECQAYICQTCHWCHEFQANHEIRVCDRCDAFYCRTCDEMDQCDDCGEVVCASCSTLLSCKFCGGGLCEECATACGRCGIVLCSRDAKFAVDCDTCRLSYCLVCLASGSKDPCVRCGHRPSKRMEQLVHLRLKSIYKAFKQSSRNNKYGAGGGDDVEEDDEYDMEDDDNDDDNFDGSGTAGDPQSLLQAAASAASKHSGGGRSTSGSRHHGSHHHPSLHHSGSVTSGGTSKRPCSEGNTVSRDQQAKDMVDKYMVEKEKADAAAAALLAELEEEEVAVQSKKNKKQRKKEREKAKKEEEQRQQQPAREFSKEQNQGDRNDESMDDRKDDDSDIEIVDIAKASSTTKHKKKKKKKDKSPENWREEVKVKNDDPVESADTKSAPSEATQVAMHEDGPKVDPIEQQLCEYVADSNFVGIEEILSTLKGVPGRAVLRKNAKKALKKIKAEQIAIEEEATALVEAERAKKQSAEEETRRKESEKAVKDHHTRATSGAGTPATHSETNSSNGRHPVPPPLPPNELLRVVSHTQGGTGAIHASSHRAQRCQTSGSAVASSAVKAECVMHLAYNVVGWVIGKGGQRIRDLMEDSGAKVWIDQEHLSPTDPRIVYVSGNRKSVEAAVKMVKELVSKAPGAPAVSTDLTGSVPAAAAIPPSHLPPTVKAASAGESDSLPLAPTAPQAAHAVGTNVGHNPFEHMTMISPGTGQNGQAGGAPSDSFLLNSDDSGNLNQRTASDQHQHLGKPTNRAENFAQEISCEACFVPLLIGRRGWTIKHIQDSSGARVDIDQTVTPRKVKISGGEQNVQSAIRMVRDVLSYPHSQLQGAGDSLEGFDHAPGVLNNEREIRATATSMDPTAATLSNTTTVAVSNQMLTPSVHQSPILTTKSATVERVHTPPPSSHINISDAKSTISASSSLSSTPEPSMASTVKGHYGVTVGTPGPLLPPDFSGSYAQIHPNLPSSNLFGQQNSLQQMNLPSLPDQRSGAVVGNLQPQQSTHFPNGIPPAASMSPVSPRYISSGLQHGFSQQQQQHQQQHHLQQQQRQQQRQHELLQQQQQQQQQHLAANMRQMNGLGGIPQQGPSYPLDVHATLHHSTSMPYSAGLSRQQQQNQTLLHQQSAFHPSDQKSMRVGSVPDIGMGHSSNAPTFAPAGMWGDGAGAGTGQAKSSNSADRFASSSLPLQGQQRGGDLPLNSTSQQQILGFGRGVIGSSQDPVLSGGLGGSAVPALKPQGKDDAQLIDSLFGPKHGGATKKDNILTGFQGLSLDEGLASDLWGKDVPQPWNTIPQGSSSLLASMQPDVNHPSQSRFGWGEKEGGGN